MPDTARVRYEPLAGASGGGSEPRRPVRVCIATPEVIGPYKCGGIGTLYTTLAESLAAAGHDVTILYLRGTYSETGSFSDWISHYADKGIELVPLIGAGEAPARGALGAVTSYQTLVWLSEREFDVVHFSELGGPGYYSMLAKRQGARFHRTTFVVGTHGPTLWVREANSEPIHELYDLENDFTERQSVALADFVWSPSRYLFGWMEDNGFELPDTRYVQPYILPQAARADEVQSDGTLSVREVKELVFFGRLETRKGLELFCDALDELHAMGHTELHVSFLGRNWTIGAEDSDAYIRRRAESWPFEPRVVSDLSQPEAIAYLGDEARLAVMPSFMDNSPNTVYECLGRRIPFLASASGGIPELIHREDRSAVCFPREPCALAERLDDALRHGQRMARPSIAFEENEARWITWHEQVSSRPRPLPQANASRSRWPRVSLCAIRPEGAFDEGAHESLRALDYPNLELVEARCGEPTERGRAWNEAARRSDGDYLLFLDERHHPRADAVAASIRVAERRGADLVTSFIDHVDDTGAGPSARTRTLAIEVFLGPSAATGGFYNCFGDGPLLVKREAFEALSGFDEGARGAEDFGWAMCLKAVLSGYRAEVVPDALFYRANDARAADGHEAGGDATDDPYPDHRLAMRVLQDALGPTLRGLGVAGPALRHRREQESRQRSPAVETIEGANPAEILLGAGRVLADGGLNGAAISLLSHARREAEAAGRPAAIVHAELVDAYARARGGERDEARNLALHALDVAEKSGSALLRLEATLRAAEIASLQRDVDTSKRLYLDAFKLARGLNKPQVMIETLTSAGGAHAAADEIGLARQMWSTASRLAEQNHFPRALERTRELLASVAEAG